MEQFQDKESCFILNIIWNIFQICQIAKLNIFIIYAINGYLAARNKRIALCACASLPDNDHGHS